MVIYETWKKKSDKCLSKCCHKTEWIGDCHFGGHKPYLNLPKYILDKINIETWYAYIKLGNQVSKDLVIVFS